MKFKELQDEIESALDQLPDDKLTAYDANPLMMLFLKMSHKVAKARMSFAVICSKYEGLRDVELAAAHSDVEGRNAEERKAKVVSAGKVLLAKERHAAMESKVEYLKSCQRIFENAHVMCRQVAQDDKN